MMQLTTFPEPLLYWLQCGPRGTAEFPVGYSKDGGLAQTRTVDLSRVKVERGVEDRLVTGALPAGLAKHFTANYHNLQDNTPAVTRRSVTLSDGPYLATISCQSIGKWTGKVPARERNSTALAFTLRGRWAATRAAGGR